MDVYSLIQTILSFVLAIISIFTGGGSSSWASLLGL